jgi:penicillin-binding protein 2
MEPAELFPDTHEGGRLRAPRKGGRVVEHEVFFEDEINALGERSFFLGQAYGKRRYLVMALFMAFFFLPLAGRAVWMQIIQGDAYSLKAESNRLRHTSILPRRGIIRDREGQLLVENIPRFQVTMTPSDLPLALDRRELVLGEAGRLLGKPLRELMDYASVTGAAQDETIILANRLSYAEAMAFAVALPRLAGFDLEVGATRHYPFSAATPSLSHVLGYVGKLSPEEYASYKTQGYRFSNDIGKTGIERTYEASLRGTPGERSAEIDVRGNTKAVVGDRPATDGSDLALEIDIELQKAAERFLQDGIKRAEAKRGALVALNPHTGAVYALVSLPAFNNNDFSGGVSSTVYNTLIANPDQPLFPRAWAGAYPSGSTVKIVNSVAALVEKVVTPKTTVVSVGGIRVGAWFFPDWKEGGHGVVNVRQAIAWSVNTFYYTIGGGYESIAGMGVETMTKWMRLFGLGSKTGIDIPGEGSGFVPSREWKEKTKKEQWYIGDTYNLSIGQGDLLVTPLQVAVYTAAIANGGSLITPHIVQKIGSNADEALVNPPAKRIVEDQTAIETVRQGMREAVTYGSARLLSVLPFPAAGKTGTAQWHSEKKTHAWFTSFAPFEQPEIVVTVLIEEGGEGSSFAAPVAKQVLEEWWRLKQMRNGRF